MDRDEFMKLVYETFADEPDNVLANGIIEAADAYAEHEKAQLSKQCTTFDLISRQAALDALNKQIQQCRKALGSLSLSDVDKHAVEVKMASLRAYRKMLENLPTIQPELTYEQVEEYCKKRCLHVVTDDFFESTKPQRLGHWILYDKRFPWRTWYKCSECGNYLDFSGVNGGRGEANYCPNCGAKMITK